MASGIERAKEALGGAVPPPWIVRAAFRARAAIGALHARMVPGFSLVLERTFGMVDTKALYCAVDLRIPDLLARGPLTSTQIAAASGADPDAVERLLRFLVMRGFFKHRRGAYANNAATDRLREDHPYSFRDWVLFFGSEWNARIWNEMPSRVRTGRPAAETALGMPFFQYLSEENPDAGRAFAGAMASGSRLQGILFGETIGLEDVRHLCDIGGGSGSVLAHLLALHPQMHGTVLDLPSLEADARVVFEDAGVAERATFVGGDFFDAVPGGCDLYVLFAVVHDWDDERCALILSNIRRVMAPGGRIMVIEAVIPPHDSEHFLKTTDMLMLVLGDGGRERTDSEFAALWTRAGLRLANRTMLPSTFEVFELVPAG